MKKTIHGTDKDFNKWVDGMIEKAIREYDRAEARKKKARKQKKRK
jgi:hypothetical protein